MGGHRRGLGLLGPAADGRPRYVLDIEPVSGTVRVGPAEALDVEQITAVRPVWSGCEPPAGQIEADVQVRAHGDTYRSTCWLDDGALRIRLHRPARGVAKGQAAVLYDQDAVLGSATIARTA
jgi:tRNA-specific 2-thiouridylase